LPTVWGSYVYEGRIPGSVYIWFGGNGSRYGGAQDAFLTVGVRNDQYKWMFDHKKKMIKQAPRLHCHIESGIRYANTGVVFFLHKFADLGLGNSRVRVLNHPVHRTVL
jgi:hypothetical protein